MRRKLFAAAFAALIGVTAVTAPAHASFAWEDEE